MKRIAMVKNGIVENIAAWDGVSDWAPEDFELVDVTSIQCDIGWLYQDGIFVNPKGE